MKLSWCRIAVMLAIALAIGCDRATDSPAPAPGPATAPAAAPLTPIDPATAPATKPTASVMQINNRLVMFPPAKLKLTDDGSRVIALLYSDDPPEAIKDSYTGNSFYLQMALDISDVKDLPAAIWTHKSRSGEREDSPYGIYLSGRKVQLQPYDVRATFSGDETLAVTIQGTFLLWNDADSTGLPQSVTLNAELPVQLESEANIKS